MKIKKILSAIIALGMIASSMATVSYADEGESKLPSVTFETYEYGTTTGTTYIDGKNGDAVGTTDTYKDGIYIPKGYTGYLVVASVSDMPEMKKASKGDHVRFGGIEAYFEASDKTNIDHIAVFTYGMIDAGATGGYLSSGEVFLKPSAQVSASYPTSATAVTSANEVSGLFIVLKDKTSPVTFTSKAIAGNQNDMYSGVTVVNYTGSTMTSGTPMRVKDNASKVASFTLGSAPVVNYPTAVEITDAPTAALNINDEVQLGATVTGGDEDKKTVTWTSSDATTVSVDSTGKIKALKATTTPVTITASVKTGAAETSVATDTVTITVNQPTPPAFKFTLGTSWNNANGYVWAGCKMENIGAGKTYTAKFTTTGETDPYTKALDLNSKTEADGTITFDAVLNTTKSSVSFIVVED